MVPDCPPDPGAAERGVLLVNLGSPDAPETAPVRRYLREFLSDPRVLDAPWPIRMMVLHLFILPFRPAKSAEAYRSIWTPDGSPLIATSRRVADALAARVDFPVALGMRYGKPSVRGALRDLADRGVRHLFCVPLYPHYAMSSYETAIVQVREEADRTGAFRRVDFRPPFFDDPDYIGALAASAAPHLEAPRDHLLVSFHGIPERHLRKSDPTRAHCLAARDCCEGAHPAHAFCYRAQTRRTAHLLARRAGIPDGAWSISYQSRLGSDPWLQPYTDHEIERLARSGVRRLKVICPAFVTDCLETLEEIAIRGRESFEAAGGDQLDLIPCLNEHPAWLDTLQKWCGAQAPAH